MNLTLEEELAARKAAVSAHMLNIKVRQLAKAGLSLTAAFIEPRPRAPRYPEWL